MNCAVLWIPTITHGYLIHPTEIKEKEDNISDKGTRLDVKVVFDPDSKNISVYCKEQGNYNLFVTLQYHDESRNGMIEYLYEDAVKSDCEFKFTGTDFPEVIYHIIKGFYHQHDFHEEKVDSSLKPFVMLYSADFNIKSPNNQALLHYLKCYEEVLRGYVAMSRFWFARLRNKTVTVDDVVYRSIPRYCLIVKGYGTYLNTLYNSRYNTWCRLEYIPEQDEDTEECKRKKELRQIAFNIENSIKYFHALEYEFSLTYQQKNTEAVINKVATDARQNMDATIKASKGSTKWAVSSIILSLIFSLGSVVYSALLSEQSSEELKATKQSLDASIKELSDVIGGISVQQDSLHKAVVDNNTIEEILLDIKHIEKTINKLQGE